MTFLHPEFLWLAPLLAAPVLIHLLNRLRYRRVRWAAIDFLVATERRAVRRARLHHLLLMALRMLLLTAVLGALAQPVFRGRLSGLLGGTTRVAVLLDSSASMASRGMSGQTFARARSLAEAALRDLPRATRVTAAAFAVDCRLPFGQSLVDREAAASLLASADVTSGRANVPKALRSAAESLARAGGGGTIWLLTDMQADGWRVADDGAWQQARDALKDAHEPRIVISDLAPPVERNLAVVAVRVEPGVLIAGDRARLIATVALQGAGPGQVANVSLSANGSAIDSRSVRFSGPGKADVVFDLPTVADQPVAGRVELAPDQMPADDRYHFVLRPTRKVPVLVVDGSLPTPLPTPPPAAPGTDWGGAPGDYLLEALSPTHMNLTGRSPFSVKVAPADHLAGTGLSDYAAVVLADVPRLGPEAASRLQGYVEAGGLVIVFPGARTQLDSWNKSPLLPGCKLASLAGLDGPSGRRSRGGRFGGGGSPADAGLGRAGGDGSSKVVWASPSCPVTAALETVWLDRVLIRRIFRIQGDAEVLATAGCPGGEAGSEGPVPFLVRAQRGRGKVYLYAVSCDLDFSSLPFSPVLLITLHRAILSHLTELSEPLAVPAFDPLHLSLPPGAQQMLTPSGRGRRALPVTALPDDPGRAVFRQTGCAGIYRLVSGPRGDVSPESLPAAEQGDPVAAVNVPMEESTLERIAPETARRLLGDCPVHFTSAQADSGQVRGDERDRVSASGFPLAVAALLFLLGEVLLGWILSRPMNSGAHVGRPAERDKGPGRRESDRIERPE